MKNRLMRTLLMAAAFVMTVPALAWAEEAAGAVAETAATVDTGDTAWVLASAALVMLMTIPGLALFYGGLARKKNVLSTIMYSFFAMVLISLQWSMWGYSLSFGPDISHITGSLDWLGLKGVGFDPNPDYAATIPHQAFMIFQMMFAVITPALISGAFAERMRFPAFIAFIILWATFIYDPVAHWVWGVNGWLRNLGALDFAGGTVVHILSGVSGLVACLVLGRRKGLGSEPMIPHNLPFTVLGAALLWFGWFGFNAGSALGANGLAASAFMVTHLATAGAALSWVVTEWIHHGKPTTLGAASGAVAGLVSITPASGFVEPMPAIVIGLVAGAVCYAAVAVIKAKLRYDDALDAFGVHGIGGTWGAIATGLFATTSVNELGADGLFYGSSALLGKQFIAIGASWAMAIIGTFVILKVISVFTKLRATDEEQDTGLDFTQHGEDAYTDFAMASPFGAIEAHVLKTTNEVKPAL
ncbi:ammonium transporter [Pelotomaculum propionicicum]|uniref:ammonium transporter n=1 Tax=Pelotomaculum propionicicum TaxID=258475 RepID=UPI003B7F2446